MVKVKTIVVGPLAVNCYLVIDTQTNEGIIIDPGADPEKILRAVHRSGVKFKLIINTHGHFDHTGADVLKEELGIPLLIHKLELPILKNGLADQMILLGFGPSEDMPEPDKFLKEGDEIVFGKEKLVVWHTPGHTPGGISLVGDSLIFTGDTLFQDGVGRTDLDGGDDAALERSLRRILQLSDGTVVYPGHGPATTVENEKPSV